MSQAAMAIWRRKYPKGSLLNPDYRVYCTTKRGSRNTKLHRVGRWVHVHLLMEFPNGDLANTFCEQMEPDPTTNLHKLWLVAGLEDPDRALKLMMIESLKDNMP